MNKLTHPELANILRNAIASQELNEVTISKGDARAIVEAMDSHDKRVTELIRATSREVIKRREINAHRIILMTLVAKLRDVLRGYARNHRGKDFSRMTATQIKDTLKKARANDQLSNECDEAMLWEPEPGAMGRP
jgi:hypothetical protein